MKIVQATCQEPFQYILVSIPPAWFVNSVLMVMCLYKESMVY